MENLPRIEEGLDSLKFLWPKVGISVRHIHKHKDGRITAQVTFTTGTPPQETLLHRATVNITSSQARSVLVRLLTERFPGADWAGSLEQVCYLAEEKVSKREPGVEIMVTSGAQPPKYLLYPILPLGKPTIIFGEGGSGKSILALVFSLLMSLPWTDNPLNLTPPSECAVVLFLDYETDLDEITWRLNSVKLGHDLPDVTIHYRRCALPLPNDLNEIQEMIASIGATCLIIDSLGAACGGDLNTAETALHFASALRQLNITALILAHTAKDPLTKRKSVFGSVFFHNFARSIWELRQVQETGEDELSIGLFHRKSNVSKLHPPLGFRLCFERDKTTIVSQDVRDIEEFRAFMGAPAQIMLLLKSGARTVREITEELEISQNAVRLAVSRLNRKGKIVKTEDNRWGLKWED